jgi:hypothetical protein
VRGGVSSTGTGSDTRSASRQQQAHTGRLIVATAAARTLKCVQPGTFKTLDAGDVGTVNRTHELRVYWVSKAWQRHSALGCVHAPA